MKKFKLTSSILLLVFCIVIPSTISYGQGLLISKVAANPAGSDSPFEYVELVATKSIDFAVTPYSVVFSNNGNATVNGWVSGAALSFDFSISTGNVTAGEVVYVGGSSMAPTGKKLRTISTGTADGDNFGKAAAGGVLGNGGANADGVAVFDVSAAMLTNNTVPVDAVFFGTGPTPGGAVFSSGSAGYQLPVNDLYNGGKLQSTSFVGPDAAGSDDLLVLSGTYNTLTQAFESPRTISVKNVPGLNPSGLPQNITLANGSSLTVTPQVLNFSTAAGSSSSILPYFVKGSALADPVFISAPQLFEISLDSLGAYSPSLTVSAEDANTNPVKIYVKFSSSISGVFSDTIRNSSGTLKQNLIVKGAAAGSSRIFDIQGTGAESPLNGLTVITEGVVTGDFQGAARLSGFYIQDEEGDDNENSSDGIFVYDNSFGKDVKTGDKIRLQATVAEFNGTTELKDIVTIDVLSSGNELKPTLLELPKPTSAFLERFEGMYVTIPQKLTVTENYNLGRYGELTLSSSGRQIIPSNYIDLNDVPSAGNNSSGQSNVASIKNQTSQDSLSRILLDDGSNTQNPAVVPYLDPTNKTLRIGTSINILTGILDYGFGTYRIEPLNTDLLFDYAPRPEVPTLSDANLKIASFNVLNFFNGNGLGGGFPTERGANTAAEFARQKVKITNAILQLDADVLGLMEMENDGDGPNSAIAELVNSLNATAGAGTYDYVRDPSGANENTGTDAIKVAAIYKTGKVVPTGSSLSDIDAINNRPPLAQTFQATSGGEKFTLLVNHFKSKGCDGSTGPDADQGDGQSCWNERRKQQAIQLLSFISDIQELSGDSDIVSIGDYNSYEQEDPLDVLRAGGLFNLISENYSFVFDGYSGSLDHAFVNYAFLGKISGALKWHINADEPRLKDYNTEFNPSYVYAPDAFRSSDHDPVLIGLQSVVTGTNKEADALGIKIFPNPVVKQFSISMNLASAGIVHISVVSPDGRTVIGEQHFNGHMGSNELIADATAFKLSAGFYFVQITADGTSTYARLVIGN